jgi:peptide/nickel transport system substrate-binding protein
MTQPRRILFALVAVIFLAAGCGGDDDDGTDAAPGTEPGDATSTTEAEIDYDPAGVLRYGTDFGDTISGHLAPFASTAVCDVLVMQPIYEGLTSKNLLTGELEPALAESWEVIDDQTVEFTLRDGVTFHDGSAFDAEAVKAGLERNAAPESGQTAATLAIIESVEAVDPSTVRVNLTEPAAGTLPILLSGREGMIVAPGAMESADTAPVGAGPFKFVSHRPGQSIKLEKNEDYWNADEVRLGGIEIIAAQIGPPQTSALLGGDIDMVQAGADTVKTLERDSNLEVAEQPTQTYYKMNWNLGQPPFNNLKFRQALNHAVDRDAIRQAIFDGTGSLAWGPYPETFYGFDADLEGFYEHDLDKAKELLEESGESNPSFTAFVPPSPSFIRMAEILQAQFKEIGVDMQIQQSTDIVQDYFTEKRQLAAVLLWPPRPDPAETLRIQFTPGNFNNPGDYSNPEMERIIGELRSEFEDDARAPLFQEGMRIAVEEALDLPLVFSPQMHAYRNTVGGEVVQNENCQGVDFRKLQINAG